MFTLAFAPPCGHARARTIAKENVDVVPGHQRAPARAPERGGGAAAKLLALDRPVDRQRSGEVGACQGRARRGGAARCRLERDPAPAAQRMGRHHSGTLRYPSADRSRRGTELSGAATPRRRHPPAMTADPAGIEIGAGAIVAFRLFEIAHTIDLGRAEAIWANAARSASRSRLST